MQFFTVAALFIASAMAAPLEARSGACPAGLYSVPQCCATDVLGVADLDCANPMAYCPDGGSLRSECASVGREAKCCVIPVAGQAVLCTNPL